MYTEILHADAQLKWRSSFRTRYLEEKADFGTAGGLVEFKDEILEGNPKVLSCRSLLHI
jgi:NDP-sugar pyrophosphorylase family protein